MLCRPRTTSSQRASFRSLIYDTHSQELYQRPGGFRSCVLHLPRPPLYFIAPPPRACRKASLLHSPRRKCRMLYARTHILYTHELPRCNTYVLPVLFRGQYEYVIMLSKSSAGLYYHDTAQLLAALPCTFEQNTHTHTHGLRLYLDI